MNKRSLQRMLKARASSCGVELFAKYIENIKKVGVKLVEGADALIYRTDYEFDYKGERYLLTEPKFSRYEIMKK